MKLILASLLMVTSISALAADKPSQLDDLIRGEMAAVKTYDQVLEKTTNSSEKKKLTSIRQDHAMAVTKLKSFADKEVREDTTTSGAWGTFTKAWVGSAKLFGNETALKALSQGEEHGVSEYKEALEDDNLKAELKRVIRTELLPKQEKHISTIKTFM